MPVHNINSEQTRLVSPKADFRTGAVNLVSSTAHNPFHAVTCSASAFNNGLFYSLQPATNSVVTTWQVNFVHTSTLLITKRGLDRIPQKLIQENETHLMFSLVFRKCYIHKTGRTRRSYKDNKTDNAVLQLLSVSSRKFIELRLLQPLLWVSKRGKERRHIQSMRKVK
jgi:hypothetical protein